tara:strand:- start:241 stop:735 length:495 start_codon:yes stop_codon:yes gene_type:complete
MSNTNLQKLNTGLANNFKTNITKLEDDIRAIADGVSVIVGTKEKPIITDAEQVPINHFFMDGVYIREMTMYKDTIVTGAIHKHLHMCFLLSGHVSVVSEEGMVDYKAPCYIISEPGTKRVLYSHENSVWYNAHKNPSNTEDLVELEKEIVAVTYQEYEEYIKNK